MNRVNQNSSGDLEKQKEEMFQLFLQMKNKSDRFGSIPSSLTFEQRNVAFANSQQNVQRMEDILLREKPFVDQRAQLLNQRNLELINQRPTSLLDSMPKLPDYELSRKYLAMSNLRTANSPSGESNFSRTMRMEQ